ncbi:hypothetical protein RCL_jg2697.t1 [Rhizophagus clarus]|uniref:Uncharacterized protein n=1 Tax=Rhizophagus clarus TaxID=94130 RepID=A0A8H3M2X2_9GLOM|nr:hypothetical protein RCL_jg2697.t1 [Rhizophagus clarus]
MFVISWFYFGSCLSSMLQPSNHAAPKNIPEQKDKRDEGEDKKSTIQEAINILTPIITNLVSEPTLKHKKLCKPIADQKKLYFTLYEESIRCGVGNDNIEKIHSTSSYTY